MSLLFDPFRRSVALAIVLIAAGFIAITVAWVGVSATFAVPTQVAFTLSGGFGGFALAGAGLAMLEIQRRRYSSAQERRDLVDFAADLGDIAELLAARRVASATPRPRRRVLRAR